MEHVTKAVDFHAHLKKKRILKGLGKFYISLALTDDDISQTLESSLTDPSHTDLRLQRLTGCR